MYERSVTCGTYTSYTRFSTDNSCSTKWLSIGNIISSEIIEVIFLSIGYIRTWGIEKIWTPGRNLARSSDSILTHNSSKNMKLILEICDRCVCPEHSLDAIITHEASIGNICSYDIRHKWIDIEISSIIIRIFLDDDTEHTRLTRVIVHIIFDIETCSTNDECTNS